MNKPRSIPPAVAKQMQAKRALDAVNPLVQHFGLLLGPDPKPINQAELEAFIANAHAVGHSQLALAHLGIKLVDVLMAHYRRQLDAFAAKVEDSKQ